MHPLTQTILAVGVLALVGIGGYAVVYGVPEYQPRQTSSQRLDAAGERADDALCQFYLSRDPGELNPKGKARRLRCLLDR